MERRRWTSGWSLVGLTASVMLAIVAIVAATMGVDEAGVRALLRVTARTSALLFTLAFVASGVRALWQSDATAWLRRNRRYVGVSFAVSHFVHLLAIVVLATKWPQAFARTPSSTLVGGSIGYVFVAAMTATSFDRSAAWIGSRNWRRLHLAGSWAVWTIFAATYVPAALAWRPVAFAFAVIVVGGAALRVIGKRVSRPGNRTSPRTASSAR